MENKLYMSAKDLKEIIPQLGINNCREIIKQVAEDFINKGNYIPKGKTILAPTKEVKKRLGI